MFVEGKHLSWHSNLVFPQKLIEPVQVDTVFTADLLMSFLHQFNVELDFSPIQRPLVVSHSVYLFNLPHNEFLFFQKLLL